MIVKCFCGLEANSSTSTSWQVGVEKQSKQKAEKSRRNNGDSLKTDMLGDQHEE